MSENLENDLNPYAPPRSALGVEKGLRRPASSWWALGVVGLDIVLTAGYIVSLLIIERMAENLQEVYEEVPQLLSPMVLAISQGLALLAAWLVLAVGGRSRNVYFIGGAALLTCCYGSLHEFYWHMVLEDAETDFSTRLVDGMFGLTMGGLLVYLVYRFFFGLPSRRYYRISQGKVV